MSCSQACYYRSTHAVTLKPTWFLHFVNPNLCLNRLGFTKCRNQVCWIGALAPRCPTACHTPAQDTQTHKPTDTHTLYTIRCVKYNRICAHKPNGDTIHDYITAGRGAQGFPKMPHKFHKMRAQGPTRPGVQTATESNSVDYLFRFI